MAEKVVDDERYGRRLRKAVSNLGIMVKRIRIILIEDEVDRRSDIDLHFI